MGALMILTITPAEAQNPRHRIKRFRIQQMALSCSTSPYELKVSTSPTRSNAEPLCGKSLSGKVYIFLTPGTGPTKVEFSLDGAKKSVENNAPWDLMGGSQSVAKPLDLNTLSAGEHVVTAKVYQKSNMVGSYTSNFYRSSGPAPLPSPSPSPTPSPAPSPEPSPGQYGPQGVTCPSGAVVVQPGQSIQGAIDSKSGGTAFCVKSGEYRLTQAIKPRSGNTLVFEPGAILNGSKLVTNWTKSGAYWIASGQTQSVAPMNVPCDLNPAACEYEDLFMDHKPMTRVLQQSQVGPGKFFFDEAADKIYIADDPTGHRIEASVAVTAIDSGGAGNVTVRGATIEKFGLHGIVASTGWVIERNEIRYVHSHALRVFGVAQVRNNYLHHAGNMGIFGEGTGLVFDTNRLAYNNYLNFGKASGLWHAGATKIVKSSNTVVRNNWSHDNLGDGWWLDWDNMNNLVENNLFERNNRFGFFYEASFDGVVRNNVFRDNGQSIKWNGSGLWINTSKNVEVYGNTFEGNKYSTIAVAWTDRGTSSVYGERQLANLNVHDNVFRLNEGFVGVPYADSRIYTSNNRFHDNKWYVKNTAGQWWSWKGMTNWSGWRSNGFDATGSLGSW
jgi:parallel beta-helix repeat protein